jgi:hypothetical protein
MRAELEKLLYEKYPDIFRQKDLPPQQTAMCWGISCDGGWYDIIDKLCLCISMITNLTGMSVEAAQVKEKHAGLRFYVDIRSVPGKFLSIAYMISDIIEIAEVFSYMTCEICGKPGKLSRTGSWYKTLCEKHRDELGYTKYEGSR